MEKTNDESLENLYLKYKDAKVNNNIKEKDFYLNEILCNSYLKQIIGSTVNNIMSKYDKKNDSELFKDLFSVAWTKVVSLVDDFDEETNVPFVAFLRTYLNYTIQDEIKKDNDFSTSKGVDTNKKIMYRLLQEYPDDLNEVRKRFKEETKLIKDSTVDEYVRRVTSQLEFLRLDKEIKNDEPQTHLSNVVSNAKDPEEEFIILAEQRLILKYINNLLTTKERAILIDKILGAENKDLVKKYNCTKQYISKTILSAQEKLKNSTLLEEIKKLRD